MRPLLLKLTPANGFSSLVHIVFRIALPLIVFVLVAQQLVLPALLVIFLSKWRIFSVQPRFWPAILRANAVDIMFGISMVVFMLHSSSLSLQIVWTITYALWLVFIKPSSSVLMVSLQAGISQLAALSALFILSAEPFGFDFMFISWTSSLPLYVLVFVAGLICYLSARHFLDSFDEPYAKMLSYLWGYFAAALIWVLGHLLVVYPRHGGVVPQPLIFLTAIGYSLAALYYLDHFDKLSRLVRRELMFITGMIVVILVASLMYEGAHLIV